MTGEKLRAAPRETQIFRRTGMNRKWLAAAVAAIAAIAIAACAAAPEGAPDGGALGAGWMPPAPPGMERLLLENGAYALFRFDLPPGATWADFDRITADYMLDEENLTTRSLRGTRLMGNYREYHIRHSETLGIRYVCFGDDTANPYSTGTYNGPFIMDATDRSFEDLGAVAYEWFTVTYDITGGPRAHGQFAGNRANAIPAADETGPFFFGLGVTGWGTMRMGVTHYIRNVTLHHASDPELSVVSTGSGFDEPAFASFPPVFSQRSGFTPLD
jgi:hypothetical protein